MSTTAPPYVAGHNLLEGKNVLITAAAGTGIGFAVAQKCIEEGARVMISDIHERRLGEATDALAEVAGEAVPGMLCNVTDEVGVQGLVENIQRVASLTGSMHWTERSLLSAYGDALEELSAMRMRLEG